MKSTRSKRLKRLLLFISISVVTLVVLGVAVSHQFPALTNGPKSSAEIMEILFKAPIRTVTAPSQYVLEHVERGAVELFIRSCDLPSDTEARLLAMLHSERFKEVTVPFIFYLYELYGAAATTDTLAIAERRVRRLGKLSLFHL